LSLQELGIGTYSQEDESKGRGGRRGGREAKQPGDRAFAERAGRALGVGGGMFYREPASDAFFAERVGAIRGDYHHRLGVLF